jgi:hypothetical protein
MRIVELPAADVAAWRACSAPLLETFVTRAGLAGSQFFMAYGRLRVRASTPIEAPIMSPR